MNALRTLVSTIAVAALLATGLAAPSGTAAPARGGHLVIATRASSEPASMDGQVDPYTSTWLFDSFVSDPLIVLTPQAKYVPGLATSWSVTSGGKIWMLKLRPNVKFHDGTPVDAEAVKFNIDRVMNPQTHSALMADYLGAKSFLKADAVDKSTVRLIYSAPVPALLFGLSIFPIWSPDAVKKGGANFQQHLVGEGAYTMTEWVKGDHVKFTRHPEYSGPPSVQDHAGAAYLESITIRFVGDDGVLGQVLKSGEVNMVMGLPSQALASYKNNVDFLVTAGYQPGNGMQFVFNTSKPPLDNVKVRQALRYAYDQNKMNQTLFDGNYVVVKGPLTKYSLYYWQGAESSYPYSVEKSKALLDEAGWKLNPRTAVREKDGKPLALTITMLHHKEIGEYLAAQFRSIGVALKIEIVPGPVQLQRVLSGDFDIMYERLRSFEPDVLFSEFFSKNNKPGGWAWTRFQNAALDETLQKTQETSDPDTRAKLFTDAQKMITEFALSLPTLDDPQFFVMRKAVKGFKLGATGNWFFVNDMYVEP
jgi:peptide/nickel transport system substrate-binding protein